MMNLSATEVSLIWGNLRNLIDFTSIIVPGNISLVGTVLGEFPVNNYHPIYLETPKSFEKFDLSGRKNFSQAYINGNLSWSSRRITSLPKYENDENANNKCLRSILQCWENTLIPEEIPCIALGINVSGYDSDGREGQYVAVLLLWSIRTARILELDWFEGPLEDCITPEWYLKVSELMDLNKAIGKMKTLFKIPPNWENLLFSLYTLPSCIGSSLLTERKESPFVGWKYEWSYYDHQLWMEALLSILEKITSLFT